MPAVYSASGSLTTNAVTGDVVGDPIVSTTTGSPAMAQRQDDVLDFLQQDVQRGLWVRDKEAMKFLEDISAKLSDLVEASDKGM